MSIQIRDRKSRDGVKTWYTFEWGKASNQRKASGIFTYTSPKTQLERSHNKDARALLEVRKSHLTLEEQSIGTGYIPVHRFNNNFLDFYTQYVKNNKREGNRHLEGSLNQFSKFIGKEVISPIDITENLCLRFRTYLLDRLFGKSPSDYFGSFKRVVKTATKEGYFRINPTLDICCKTNPSKYVREFLEADEYIQLVKTPIFNTEVRDAFIICCFTGLRWVDIKALEWQDTGDDGIITRIIQKKTGKPVEITLHPVVKEILKCRKQAIAKSAELAENPFLLKGKVFDLPTADGANSALKKWVEKAKIKKAITWHSARLSFSILLQDANVDTATVALLLGHTSTRYVNETYKRHRPKDHSEHLNKLPDIKWDLNMLDQ